MGAVLRKAVFQPPEPTYTVNGREYVLLKSYDHVDIPLAEVGSDSNPRFAILYSHGNGEDLGQVHDWCERLSSEFHAVVYAWDYRGYGPRRGFASSEMNVFSDIEVVYAHIRKRFPENRILFFGRSLGCAPSIASAAKHTKALGLIIESPFLTCIKTVFHTNFTFWFDMFRNETNIQGVKLPVLVIHGKEDRVVPFSHGVKLFQECQNPWSSLWLEHAGHNDIDTAYQYELFQKIQHFLTFLDPSICQHPLRRRRRCESTTM